MRIHFLSVDLQYDFTQPGGKHYNPKRSCLKFIRGTLIPYFEKHVPAEQPTEQSLNEIISDYRLPRPGDEYHSCDPGEPGYTSEFASHLLEHQWVKCMNSPIFTREGIGRPHAKPGLPYPDGAGFAKWIKQIEPDPACPHMFVIFGLTLECCVLCTAQMLRMLGYNPRILLQATDTYDGNAESKRLTQRLVVDNWAKAVTWNQVLDEVG